MLAAVQAAEAEAQAGDVVRVLQPAAGQQDKQTL